MAVLGGATGSTDAGGSPGLRALVANARQLLVAFCSLSGEVLPRRPKQVLLQHGAEAIAAAAAAQGEEGGGADSFMAAVSAAQGGGRRGGGLAPNQPSL